MKGKIIYLIILVAVGCSFINAITTNTNDIYKEIKENVIIVKNGKLDEENEGKLVLVSGELKSNNTFDLKDYNIKFNTCYIDVEGKIKKDDKWEDQNNYVDIVDAKLGEYVVPKELIKKTGSLEYYKNELKGYTYDEEESSYYISEDGNTQVKFKYMKLNEDYTVLAKQEGNNLVPYKLNDGTKVYEIYHNKLTKVEDLSQYFKRSKKGKIIFTGILLAGVLFIGYSSFIKKKEN